MDTATTTRLREYPREPEPVTLRLIDPSALVSSEVAEADTADLHLLKEETVSVRRETTIAELLHSDSENSIRVAGEELLHRLGGDAHAQLYSKNAQAIKRAFDIIGAIFALLLFAPIFLISILLIKVTSPGPVFFAQERLGRHGRWFKALKFRTMYPDAEAKLQELLASDPALREEYQEFHKLANDPRVTPIGKFLRKSSLDEIPQLINVLRGEMSLVGPRAYMPFEVPEMQDMDRILVILQVKPGLTGFWQVGGRNNVSFEERLDMDVFYIRNWSLGMDLYLVINTVWIMLFSRGFGAS